MTLERRSFLRGAAAVGVLTLSSNLLAACGESKSDGTAGESGDDALRIGLALWGTGITFAPPMVKGMKDKARELGVEFEMKAADFDASVQVQQVQEFVQAQVDVIGICPVDVQGIVPVATAAKSQGAHVVACTGKIEGFPYIGADDLEYGRIMAELMVQALADVEGPKKIALLRGLVSGSPDRLRREGIDEVLAGHDDIEIVAEVPTDWDAQKGLAAVQDLLTKYGPGELHLIHGFGSNVEVTGAKYAATSAKRTDVIFTGAELATTTAEAIEKGWMYGIVNQDPYTLGQTIVQGLNDMAPDFSTVPPSAKVPLPIVTQANLREYDAY